MGGCRVVNCVDVYTVRPAVETVYWPVYWPRETARPGQSAAHCPSWLGSLIIPQAESGGTTDMADVMLQWVDGRGVGGGGYLSQCAIGSVSSNLQ